MSSTGTAGSSAALPGSAADRGASKGDGAAAIAIRCCTCSPPHARARSRAVAADAATARMTGMHGGALVRAASGGRPGTPTAAGGGARRFGGVPAAPAAGSEESQRSEEQPQQQQRPCSRARSRGPSGEDGVANVRVVCRIRPMSEREKRGGAVPAATGSTERREVTVARMANGQRQVRSSFQFDAVLGSFSTQEDVFNSTLRPLIDQVLEGYEATAFAYGQTGTGKTYTMEGEADAPEARGLMPRAAAAVLDTLRDEKYTGRAVTVSYLEIYNEELSDLLAPAHLHQKLELMDTVSKRVCCVGLSEVRVESLSDILDLVRTAQERRRVAETRVNARSSRSHCIFTMKVATRQRVEGGELETVGKLHLVDLAGSECAKKAAWTSDESTPSSRNAQPSVIAEQERERRAINQSLLTLGRVIAAARGGSGRVPYRDSKLTRLLQDALGGSCRTVLIATISPAMVSVEETISTLTYADQASAIQNRPTASVSLRNVRGTGTVGCEARGDGSGSAGTFHGSEWAEVEMKLMYLQQEVEEAQSALARKQQEASELAERAQKAEQESAQSRKMMEECRRRSEAAEAALATTQAELDTTRQELSDSRGAHAEAVATCRALRAELERSASESLAAREGASLELASIRERSRLEDTVLSGLTRQRQALADDAEVVRDHLGGAEAELSATRAAVLAMRGEQEAAAGRVLQALVEFAKGEFDKMGSGLAATSTSLASRLDAAAGRLDSAKAAAADGEARGAQASNEVASAASSWCEDLATRREAAGRSFGNALTASENVATAAAARVATMQAHGERHAAAAQCVFDGPARGVGASAAAKENNELKAEPLGSPAARKLGGPALSKELPGDAIAAARSALKEVN
eukprot:TRINITY_DN3025_c0_g2_i1.p1 TRINITY_DN3025_c0_g2~~TRINITY_DN3025_c0_g2_i1.p1  ORF type:complete len:871 (-),score=240.62 TRINITY_DN3025_c0_g2_i1:49-2661(-)